MDETGANSAKRDGARHPRPFTPCGPPKCPPAGPRVLTSVGNLRAEVVRPGRWTGSAARTTGDPGRPPMIATGKSQQALDAEAAGSRVADSLSGRPLALSCLSGRAPLTRSPKPCMNARAHSRTRARHDTSGLGTVIRISLSVFRQVRQRTRSHPDSTPHAPPKRLKHPVDPPCGRAGPRFARR